MVHSITKAWLCIAEAQEIIDELFNSLPCTLPISTSITRLLENHQGSSNNHRISSLEELPDGSFNSCFLATIPLPKLPNPSSGGNINTGKKDLKLVIKVSPPPYVRVLRYESSILDAEATILRLIKAQTTVPVPEVLEFNDKCDIIDSPYLVMEYIPGTSLDKLRSHPDSAAVYELDKQVGIYLREINTIKGQYYGMASKAAPRHSSRRDAYLCTTESILRDGEDMLVLLPYQHIRTQIRRCSFVLDEFSEDDNANAEGGRHRHMDGFGFEHGYDMTERAGGAGRKTEPLPSPPPRLSIMDFWDGSVLVDVGSTSDMEGKGEDNRNKTPRIAGFIDFERSVWGDPLSQEVLLSGPTRGFWEGYYSGGVAVSGCDSFDGGGTSCPRRGGEETSRNRCKRLLYLTQVCIMKIVASYYRQLSDTEVEMLWRKRLIECLQGLTAET